MSQKVRVGLPVGESPASGVGSLPVGGQPLAGLDTTRIYPQIDGSIDSVRVEIDDAFEDMKLCANSDPDEAMRLCGGHSARLSELRVRIQRVEDFHRQWKAIRTREIEPALEELANQFAIASRLHSVRELDWRMETGQR